MKQALAAIGTVVLACSLVYGQAPADTKAADSKLEFEVATIKASAPRGNGPIRIGSRGGPEQGDPGRITYHNSTLRDLLVYAYGVKRNQISGAPEWLDSQRFDITAKIPEGATKEQVKVMLQNLLADRFKAVLHNETKEMPMYALLVSKSGPKMKESAAPANPPPAKEGEARPSGDGPPPPPALPGRMPMAKDGCPEAP